MAMTYTVNVELPLVGDGASTTFTYSMSKLFGIQLDQSTFVLSGLTNPTSATVIGTSGSQPAPTASLDTYGNLVLTFGSAWANASTGTVTVQLAYASGVTPPNANLIALAAQGTALNAAQTIFSGSGSVPAVLVQLTQTTTLTAGAVTFEVSYDGSTWNAIPAELVVDPTSSPYAPITLPYTVQASTNKQFLLLMNGAQALRIRTSTAITGTGTVTPNYALLGYIPLQEHNISQVGGNAVQTAASGTQKVGVVGSAAATLDSTVAAGTAPTNALATLVQFNSTIPALTAGQTVAAQSDQAGSTYVNNEGRKATYHSVVAQFTPAATATDIVTISGSASKTIRVTYVKIEVFAGGSGSGFMLYNLIKRSAANTGGTVAAQTLVPEDSNDAAATTVINKYTANATALGAAVGTIDSVELNVASSANASRYQQEFFFPRHQGGVGSHALVLRGTSQLLAINQNGVSMPTGGLVAITIAWTEE